MHKPKKTLRRNITAQDEHLLYLKLWKLDFTRQHFCFPPTFNSCFRNEDIKNSQNNKLLWKPQTEAQSQGGSQGFLGCNWAPYMSQQFSRLSLFNNLQQFLSTGSHFLPLLSSLSLSFLFSHAHNMNTIPTNKCTQTHTLACVIHTLTKPSRNCIFSLFFLLPISVMAWLTYVKKYINPPSSLGQTL